MEKPKLIYILFVLLMLSTTSLILMNQDLLQMHYLYLVLGTGFLFLLLSRNLGFLLLITEILLAGYFITYDAYYYKLTSIEQIPVVLEHVIFAVTITLLWVVLYIIKKDRQTFIEMKDKLQQLQRFEPQTNVFTQTEFKEKATVIWTGMKRRNEQGFIMLFSLMIRQNIREVHSSARLAIRCFVLFVATLIWSENTMITHISFYCKTQMKQGNRLFSSASTICSDKKLASKRSHTT
ncbi:hypothetical protein G4V62_16305 [Bacillaceae bacterium SIJ1]|uniref:hypothetical protein n=1 Tax=Litoribacterium kuwaitense TaxID=1398745 RepID=UPI0013ED40FE|nr:hypothetical protein [Litoribacterium kuwaitense]NGP46433.1 hypothetical protein [Litoribacterium kuwaitense]